MTHHAKGGKVRRGGLAEKAVRAARRAAIEERTGDQECRTIAQSVYGVAVALKGLATPTVLPLDVEACLTYAFERIATGIARRDEIPVTEENVSLIAGYLMAATRFEVQEFTPAHLEKWRADQAAGQVVSE